LKPLPDLKNLLRILEKKYKLAITTGSNSNIVNKFLTYHHLQNYFCTLTTGEQFKSSKPNPECYVMTLKKLKISPSEAIIVEDSYAGIMAGKKAGCKVFGLKNEYNVKQLKDSEHIFNNYKEMIKYFRSIE
jgi:HAD superfamily hydrolase (TIGR01509 family)